MIDSRHERPRPLRGVPHRQAGGDRDRSRGARRAEAKCCPDQDREHDVGHVSLRRHLDQDDQHRKHHRALRELHARHPPRPAPRPDEDEAERRRAPPRNRASHQVRKTLPNSPALITSPSLQRHDAEHRADQRPDRGTDDEREHIPDALEPDPPSGQPTEQNRRDDDLERVPERLAQHRPPRRREVGHQQVADHDRRPDARPEDHERSHPDAHRRPQRRDAPVQVRQVKTGARGSVVQPGDDADLDAVPREPSEPGSRQDRRRSNGERSFGTGATMVGLNTPPPRGPSRPRISLTAPDAKTRKPGPDVRHSRASIRSLARVLVHLLQQVRRLAGSLVGVCSDVVVRYVALLRGINVGGKTLIKMAELRACVEALGLDDVSTYIASGNVLFESGERDAAKLETTIERAHRAAVRAPGEGRRARPHGVRTHRQGDPEGVDRRRERSRECRVRAPRHRRPEASSASCSRIRRSRR